MFLGDVLQFHNKLTRSEYMEVIADRHTVRIGLHLRFLELFKAITRLLLTSAQASIRIKPQRILFG